MPASQTFSRPGCTPQTHCLNVWVLLIAVVFVTLFAQTGALAAQRYYTIQVSSNKKQQSAVAEVNRFKKQGYEAFYRYEKLNDKGNWYRVYVGRYGTREDAVKEAKKLKKQGHLSFYTIRAYADLVTEEAPRKEASEKKSKSSTSPEKGAKSEEKARPGDGTQGAPAKSETAKVPEKSQTPPRKEATFKKAADRKTGKGFVFSTPDKKAPGAGKDSQGQAPTFQRAPAKPGAGGPVIKFKGPGKKEMPEKKEVTRETVPAEKEASQGLLRRKGVVVTKDAVRKMLLKHRFYSTCSNHNFDFCNPDGDFANQFEDNGDGTVTDRATHLMWQKGGSVKAHTFLDALKYAHGLNKKSFGGHSDWRVPTIEELASLLESSWKNEDLYIDPVFDTTQKSCWSTDTLGLERAWEVDFHLGYVADDPMNFLHRVRAVRSVQ